MKYNQNDRVLVNGAPAQVIRHDQYTMPNGKTMGIVHVQIFDANKGWVEYDADESIVKPEQSHAPDTTD